MTLDDFCGQTSLQPAAIKLDVDGTEPRVLAGASETLRSPQLRTLIIEMPEDASARRLCIQQLTAAGLRQEWRDPNGHSTNEVWGRPTAEQKG